MKNSNYMLGLVSVSFRQHSPEDIVKAAKEAGLSCIEWGSDVHAPCRDVDRLQEIVKLQKKYGIACSSYGTYFRLGETPMEELESYISAAKILGTKVLRLWCGTKSGEEYSADERRELIDRCRLASQMAKEAEVILCLECHQRTFTQRLEDALALMEEIGSPHFCMYWQPFQWQGIKENLAYAEAIAPVTHHIHVFQWKDKERFSLHEGIEEWKGYLKKFSTPRTLLLEFMPNGRMEELSGEAAALKTVIGEKL